MLCICPLMFYRADDLGEGVDYPEAVTDGQQILKSESSSANLSGFSHISEGLKITEMRCCRPRPKSNRNQGRAPVANDGECLFAFQNIELKVEVESLKRELQDRKQHLHKTW